MFTANTPAKAKLIYVKNKNTYKVVIAFNVHKELVGTNYKHKFPTQAKCAYVSGDLPAETLKTDVVRVMQTAQQALRTNDIQFVE
jgi:hypothetical protein